MTVLDLLAVSDAPMVLDLLSTDEPSSAACQASGFDNQPTWDNVGDGFDNRPTWDNWSNK